MFRLVVDTFRVTFAFEAAVAILVVLTPVSVFAAARARVIRLGGDWSSMLIEVNRRWGKMKQRGIHIDRVAGCSLLIDVGVVICVVDLKVGGMFISHSGYRHITGKELP